MSDPQASARASSRLSHRTTLTTLQGGTESPFFVGRGEAGNHLALPDMRISRQCAAVVAIDGRHYLEDRGHRLGVFINEKRITRQPLEHGDIITFGLNDSYRLVFRYSEDTTPNPTLAFEHGRPRTRNLFRGG